MSAIRAETLLESFAQLSPRLSQVTTIEEALEALVSALESAGLIAGVEPEAPAPLPPGTGEPSLDADTAMFHASGALPHELLEWQKEQNVESAPCMTAPIGEPRAPEGLLKVSHPDLCEGHLPVVQAFVRLLEAELGRLKSPAGAASDGRLLDRLDRMDRLSLALVQSLDISSILEQSLAALVDTPHGECGALYSLEGSSLRVVATSGFSPGEDASAKRSTIALGRGTLGEVVQSSEVRVGQFPAIADILPYGLTTPGESRNAVFVPIQGKEHSFGVLVIGFARDQDYRRDDLQFWENVGRQIGLAAENAQLFEIVRRSRGRFRQLIDTANAVIFALDENGRFSHFNDTAEELTGYTRQELVGQPFERLVEESRQAEATRLWGRIWSAQQSITFELPIRTREQGECLIRWTTADDVDHNDRKVGVVFVGQDITRQKELERALSQAKKLAALGTMIAGVAHEINNPLTAVIGFSEFLANDESLPEGARHELEVIHQQGQRCREVVDNLLHFSRKDIGTQVGIDINHVIQACLQLREYQFHLEEIKVELDLDDQLPSIVGDPTQLRTAMLNVINNGFDVLSGRQGGGTLWIRTRPLPEEKILIEVEDSGGGVENPERVFEPFYTTKGVGEGTGLGLSATYGIVVDHGGRIQARNTGQGACFAIELPVHSGVPIDTIQIPDDGAPAGPAAEGQQVLVIDDEAPVSRLMAEVLTSRGYEALEAHDVDTALKQLEAGAVDAIVCDVRMPGKRDGMWLYRWLQENQPERLGRVVFLTGDLISEHVRAFIAECQQPVLAKPFTLLDFTETVDQLFD